MVSPSDVKNIVIFSYLTEDMIQKLLPEIELLRFQNGEIIFRRGEAANIFLFAQMGQDIAGTKDFREGHHLDGIGQAGIFIRLVINAWG